MMEPSTQTNNYERHEKVGRPNGTCLFTDEEKRTSKNDIKAILLFKY